MRRRPLEPEPGNAGGGKHGTSPLGARVRGRRPTDDLARSDDLPANALVSAADSGLDHARALGITVDVVVGDLDSVSPDVLARGATRRARRSSGTRARQGRHRSRAGACSRHAIAARTQIVVVGGARRSARPFPRQRALCSRHLRSPKCASVRRFGDAEVVVVRDRAELTARARLALLAARGRRAGGRSPDRGTPLSPRARDPLPGLDSRGEQRARRADRAVVVTRPRRAPRRAPRPPEGRLMLVAPSVARRRGRHLHRGHEHGRGARAAAASEPTTITPGHPRLVRGLEASAARLRRARRGSRWRSSRPATPALRSTR